MHHRRTTAPAPGPGPAPATAPAPVAAAPPGAGAGIIVVGAGAAGLALTHELTRTSGDAPGVLLIDPPPGPDTSPDRTWCFWGDPGGAAGDPAVPVAARWPRLLVRGRDGRAVAGDCVPPYRMIRSGDYLRALGAELAARPGVRRLTGTVTGVRDGPRGAEVHGADAAGRPFRHRARWVFDSRPPRRLPPARTTLWQHFRGWFVRTERDAFDPDTAELMDLRTPQPARGLSFVYVLPFDRRTALLEYTEFSAAVRDADGYREALEHYTRRVRPLGPFTVTRTEQGAIPMTDGAFPRRAGRSVLRIGAAGGATRPSTGYTFAAVQRQCAAVAAAHRAGRVPLPPRPYARRHRVMDAAWLRALATGRLDGAAFLEDLFRRHPLERVLRFLDGRSGPADDLAIGLRAPVPPLLRSLAELPLLPRRAPAPPPGARPYGPAYAEETV